MLITYMTFEDGRKIVAPTWPGATLKGWQIWKLGIKYGFSS